MKPPRVVNVRIVSLAAFVAALSSSVAAVAQDGPATAPAEPASPSGAAASPSEPPARVETPSDPALAVPEPPQTLTFVEPSKTAPGTREDVPAEEPDDGTLRHHQDHFLGFVGVRVGKVTSPGFDPFSDSDELAQVSLGFGKTLFTSGNFSLAGLALYDYGGHSGEARNAETDLTVHRVTIAAEARYHFIRQLFVFGRVAPGAIHSIAQVEDHTAGDLTLAAREWVFATDLSAGAMLELTGWTGHSNKRTLGAWLAFDGGYGFAGESELSLTPDEGAGPERAEPVDLGPLALGGPFLRFSAVLTY